jgi:excisionase family DNA binding protein
VKLLLSRFPYLQDAAMATDDQTPLAVDKRQAAKLLSISQTTIDRLRREGRLKAVKLDPKGKVLFTMESLRGFLASINKPETANVG